MAIRGGQFDALLRRCFHSFRPCATPRTQKAKGATLAYTSACRRNHEHPGNIRPTDRLNVGSTDSGSSSRGSSVTFGSRSSHPGQDREAKGLETGQTGSREARKARETCGEIS